MLRVTFEKEELEWERARAFVVTKGGQKTVKPDPPDQSGRPVRSSVHPSVSIYTDGYRYGYRYFKYPDNGFWNFGRVDTRPPDNI